MDLVTELCKVYENEDWHSIRLSDEEARRYHEHGLQNGSILCATEDGVLKGYLEIWKLSFEQLGRVLCGEPFSPMQEEVFHGPVAYLANIWIKSDERDGRIMKILRLKFFGHTTECKFITGHLTKRLHAPFQIFKRGRIMSTSEVFHG